MKVLECHSRGDKRFSPLFCEVSAFGIVDTIENHYQCTKRFRHLDTGVIVTPKDYKEAKALNINPSYTRSHFELPNGMYLGDTNSYRYDLVIQYYTLLWYKYLKKHPELIEYAKGFDEYVDIFKGSFPYCQADVIRDASRYGVDYLRKQCTHFEALLRSYENGQRTYSPSWA